MCQLVRISLHATLFFLSKGHKKLPTNQSMIKAVEKDTKDIEKK